MNNDHHSKVMNTMPKDMALQEHRTFSYYLPTEIRFGVDSLQQIHELREVNGHKCLLLTYPGFHHGSLVNSLQQVCRRLTLSSEFQENPGNKYIQDLAGLLDLDDIDTIIAIGGGSCIDTAKALVWHQMNASGKISSLMTGNISVVAVPTTAGTGSEVTPYAILRDDETNKKHILNHPGLYPKVAVCDPVLTKTMPGAVTANTGIDALSHAIEAYFSKKCNGFMEDIALNTCKIVALHLRTTILHPDQLFAREQMMLASLQGGIVLSQCGTVIVHALGYGLSREFGYPHGYANAVLLAGYVERMKTRGCDRANKVSEIFGHQLDLFIQDCGINLPENGRIVSQDIFDQWVDDGYQSYGRVNSILPLGKEDIRSILHQAINIK